MRFLVDESTGKRFGELIFRLQRRCLEVLLRTDSIDPETRFKLISGLLKVSKVAGKFIVLKESGARVRKLD